MGTHAYGRIARRRFDDERLAFLEPADIGVLDQVWLIALDDGEAVWEGAMPTDVLVPAEALNPRRICRELPRTFTIETVEAALERMYETGAITATDDQQVRVHALGEHNPTRFRERERKRTKRKAPKPAKKGAKKKAARKPQEWRQWADAAIGFVLKERGVRITCDSRLHATIRKNLRELGRDELTKRYARYVKSKAPTLAKHAPAFSPFFRFGFIDHPEVLGIDRTAERTPNTRSSRNASVLDDFAQGDADGQPS